MKVKIERAERPTYWYARMIGQIIEVEDEHDDRHYYAGPLAKYGFAGVGIIDKESVSIVSEGVPEPNEISKQFEEKVKLLQHGVHKQGSATEGGEGQQEL